MKIFVGFDTEFSFGRVLDLENGRLHGDVTTMDPVCACLCFSDGREMRISENWQQLQRYFDDPANTFIVHGGHAETGFCKRVGLRFPPNYFDTLTMMIMVLHACAFKVVGGVYKNSALTATMARYHLPFIDCEEKDAIREAIMRGTHLSHYGMEKVLNYCMADARASVQVFKYVYEEFRDRCGTHAERNLRLVFQPYAQLMADASLKGIRFDTKGWDRLLNIAPKYRKKLTGVMKSCGYEHDGPGISHLAFDRMLSNLGLKSIWPRTKTGRAKTAEDVLKDNRNKHSVIDAAYSLSRFDAFMAQDIGARVDRDGRLRCGILPLAQHTGRNSTINPNLAGMPGELRPLLLPDDGAKFVLFDYPQQEPGIAGWLSRDQALLADYASADVYLSLGKRLSLLTPGMTDEEVLHVRNRILKKLMLAILYGKGAQSIAVELGVSHHEAQVLLANFKQTYPAVFRWQKSFVAGALQSGWAENVIGFRAAFKAVTASERGHVARSCQNFPIQSAAAACFQLTGLYLGDFGADIRLPLHDAYLINTPNNERDLEATRSQILSATATAVEQLFPGLAVRRDIDVLSRFAKDTNEQSFQELIEGLEIQP